MDLRERLLNWIRWSARVGLVAAIGLYGLWSYPLALLGPDRTRIPGDLGDARFNNYVLEHFHRYVTGKEPGYWDAPFMYPYEGTIAQGDNLLGTAPLYAVFRVTGFNRESAFQLWILVLFALNYSVCAIVLWRWCRDPVLAACGAFVFAFGIHTIGHLHHAQVLPRFMVPVAFFLCTNWLRNGRLRTALLLGLAVVFQFYCGISLGLLLCYALGAVIAAHVLLNWRTVLSGLQRRSVIGTGVVFAGCGALLLPLLLPYMRVDATLGTRSFEEVAASIPRPVSYFFTHPAAVNWRSLSLHSRNAFDEWWHHFHFMGSAVWIGLLLSPLVVRKGNRELRTILLACGLATLFCLRIGDFTLWRLVRQVPGFSALRSVDQFMNVQAMFFVAILILVCAALPVKPLFRRALPFVLLGLVVLENRIDVGETKWFDKYAAQHLVTDVERDILSQPLGNAAAVAYQRALPFTDAATWHDRLIETHLSAMLAGQRLGIPVVNAYTGSYPQHYLKFFDGMDRSSLEQWCAFNSIPSDSIAVVSNAGEGILGRDTVLIIADNGRYLSADLDQGMTVLAVRERSGGWETFIRVKLSGDRIAFVSHTGAFLCAELEEDARVSGTSERLGDFGLFVEVPVAGGMAWRADNGRYVSRDTLTNVLFANSDSLGANCVFRYTSLPTRSAH